MSVAPADADANLALMVGVAAALSGYSLLQVAEARGVGVILPEHINSDFGPVEAAKAEIRAAVQFLLSGVSGNSRADMVRDIVEIVRQVANSLPGGRQDPLDDDLPGG
jgi:hypothetical protein